MKKSTKFNIIFSSIAAIALAGSVLAGGTYALFTSESQTNIAVNSGNVKVVATVSDLNVYSPKSISTEDGNAILDADNVAETNSDGLSGTFYNGGTAELDDTNGKVTLDKMTPGDKVTFKLDIQNYSNVKTKYRISILKTDDSDENLFAALEFNIGGRIPDYYTRWQKLDIPSSEEESIKSYNCEIELPTNISGSEYMNKTCTVEILVEAIQFNAKTDDSAAASQEVTQTVNTSGNTTLSINDESDASVTTIEAVVPADSIDETSGSVTSLTLIKTPTEVPGNLTIETGTNAISTDVKIIDQDGNKISAKNEKYFTITIQLDDNLDLTNFYHNAVELTSVESTASLTTAGQYYYEDTSGRLTFTTADFSTFTATYKFSGGLGTEEAPYLIGSVNDLKSIYDYRDNYQYYKIADEYQNGAKDFDLSTYSGYNVLNGSFDGNGANLTNLKQCLFNRVGAGKEETMNSVIKNLNVNFEGSNKALVFDFNGTELTFNNVNISGSIEGQSNVAAFLQYGTCNIDDVGWDYTLNFVNCSCSAIINSTTNASAGILVGHIYAGRNNTCTIKLDNSTYDKIQNARIVLKKGSDASSAYLYAGIQNYYRLCVYKNGSSTPETDTFVCLDESHVEFFTVNNPTKDPTSYSYKFTRASNATKYTAFFKSQRSAYDSNGNTISSLVGITASYKAIEGLEKKEFTESDTKVEIFTKIEKIKFVQNGDDNGLHYSFDSESETLTLYCNNVSDYKYSGTVSIAVTQYDKDNTIIASGELEIVNQKTELDSSAEWTVSN